MTRAGLSESAWTGKTAPCVLGGPGKSSPTTSSRRNQKKQLYLATACEENPDIKVGEFIEDEIEVEQLGRIAAHKAKQVVLQKVREYEREHVHEKYREKVGTIISGVVRRRPDRKGAYLDLEGTEAFLPRSKMILHEIFHPNDRVRALLEEVAEREKGPQLILSRASEQFLYELLRLEIPEISQGIIGIKAIVRKPGQRSKVAVFTNEPQFDPVGACVGMRGSRVQTISNDLAGERIDVLLWDPDPLKFVINALNSEIIGITVDEATTSMEVVVREEHMTQIIGRNGQNVLLASQLTGWTLDIVDEKSAQEREAARRDESRQQLIEQLQIEPKVADILIREDYTSLEEIAYSPQEEMLQISEFGAQLVERLRARAQDVLLSSAVDENQDANHLSAVPGMDDDIIEALKQQGVFTCSDLADQSVFDIELPQLEAGQLGQLILEARKITDAAEAAESGGESAVEGTVAEEESNKAEQEPSEGTVAEEESNKAEQEPSEGTVAEEESNKAEQEPFEGTVAEEESNKAEQEPFPAEPATAPPTGSKKKASAKKVAVATEKPLAEPATAPPTGSKKKAPAKKVAVATEKLLAEPAKKVAVATAPPTGSKKKAPAKKVAVATEKLLAEPATVPPTGSKKKAPAKKVAVATEKTLAEPVAEGS